MLFKLLKGKEFLALALSLVFLGAIIYGPSFKVKFQLDDTAVIVKNFVIRDIGKPLELFRYDPTRFLTHVSFGLNFRFGGLKVFYFHLINLFLHVICAFLVYYLMRRTLNLLRNPPPQISQNIHVIAFFCSLIFLTHPLQTQSVTYIVQRSTLLAALFYFLSLLVYLCLKVRFTRRLYLWSWLLMILGTMTKPIFVTLPLAVLLYEICFFNFKLRDFGKNFRLFLPYLLVPVIIPVFLVLFSLNYFSESFDLSKLTYATRVTSEISRWDYLLTQFRVLVTYLRLLFFPLHQNLDYDYPLSHSFFGPGVIWSFFILAAILASTLLLFKKQRLFAFSILWFFIVLIPESSIFPISDVIFEHRLYLAVAGFAVFLSTGVFYVVKNSARSRMYLACIVVVFSIATFARNSLWQNELKFWQDVVAASPQKARPHNILGLIYQERGSLDEAEAEYLKATDINEKYLDAYNNLAHVYVKKKRRQDAEVLYKKILLIAPEHFAANLNLGNLYYDRGQYELAFAQFKRAVELSPKSDVAFANLGYTYFRLGKPNEAETFFRQALKNNPRYAPGYYALGELYLTQQRSSKTIEALTQAIAINSAYADAYTMLGIAYSNAGNILKAEQSFKKAVELKPDMLIGYLNLANYYQKQGNSEKAAHFSRIANELKKRHPGEQP